MSDMVEAVAKALYEHDASLSSIRWVLWPDNRAPRSLRQKRDKYLAKARAAIEALREPSEAMIAARFHVMGQGGKAEWEAMISAALGEAAK